MSKKLPTGITKDFLVNVPIPNHGGRYTVISHKSIIDNSTAEITAHGFTTQTELYRASINGNVANGMTMLNFATDADLKMMFVWGNSYDKSTRFKCGIGAYIESTGNYMFAGDLSNYSRKHTGNADQEALLKMRYQLAQAKFFYNMLVEAKQKMEALTLTDRKMAEILGILYAEKEYFSIEQVSSIKSYMGKSIIPGFDHDNLWNFYNVLCMALRNSHPKSWFESQTGVHQFIMNEVLFTPNVQPIHLPAVSAVETEEELPGQLNILDAIAEAESKAPASEQTATEDDDLMVKEDGAIEEPLITGEDKDISEDEEEFFNFGVEKSEPESQALDFPEL
jgi:hypothetical protein